MTKQTEALKNDPDKIWVNIERTVNLGNYENIKLSVGESRTVGPDDDPIDLRDEITTQCLDEIDKFVGDYK